MLLCEHKGKGKQSWQKPESRRPVKNQGSATKMMQGAAMQANTPDVVALGLINGSGCLPCQAARKAAARSFHYSQNRVINEV